jgi:uncharacterized membrane-anchored protein
MTARGLDAVIARVPALARTAIVGAALCALILALVLNRAAILRDGVEVRLQTLPVDPRDLFRGDYVVLSYDIGLVNLTRLAAPDGLAARERVHVGLAAGPGGQASAVAIARQGQPRRAGLVWIEGRIEALEGCWRRRGATDTRCAEGDRMARIVYGLESYFVPQGEGLAIERTEASRVEVVAAVTASGASAIKRLLIDGKPVYDEPPF